MKQSYVPVQDDFPSLHSDNLWVERKTVVTNIFLKPLFRGNFDPFVNNANLGAIAHMSNGT